MNDVILACDVCKPPQPLYKEQTKVRCTKCGKAWYITDLKPCPPDPPIEGPV